MGILSRASTAYMWLPQLTLVLMGTLARRPPATMVAPPMLLVAPVGLKCLIAWLMKAAGCWMAARSKAARWRTASAASSAPRLLLSWCTTPSSKS